LDESVARLGLDPSVISPDQERALASVSILRPFVRVELASSLVDGDPNDKDRWYRYIGGVAVGDQNLEPESGALYKIQDGKVVLQSGDAGVISASASDNFSGQTGSARWGLAGLGLALARLVRPMDRMRITIRVPGIPEWVLFDGFVRLVRGSSRAGAGWSASLQIDAAGLQHMLSQAIFNWQGFIHPDSTILNTPNGETLAEALFKSALPPHRVVRAFLESAINSSMGLRIGDPEAGNPEDGTVPDGLKVSEYCLFDPFPASDWESWPGSAFPLPWSLIHSQSGSSYWGIVQAMAEPILHEVFVGYRAPQGRTETEARPTLIHRPRPLPGSPEFDGYWHALPVVKVGGQGQPSLMGVEEALSGDQRANCFHWTGLGVGDHSMQAFQAKLFWGWASSDALVNRFGYSSHPLSSKLAPIEPGAKVDDYLFFAQKHMLHYARQEAALPLLKFRRLDAVFIPVRPGQVLEDHSLGDSPDKVVTGYVTSTDWRLVGSGDSFSMSFGANVERCLKGCDAPAYPDAVRALVPDMELKAYAGKDVGPQRKAPAVTSAFKPGKYVPAKPEPIPNEIYDAIKAASKRQQIPAWLIAHVLQNETGFGRNWNSESGEAAAKAKGIGQITEVAVADLVSIGYLNVNTTPFKASDRGDVGKNIHAVAAFLKRCQDLLAVMPGGFTTGESYYSWVARSYRWGAGDTRLLGASTGWTWPPAGEAFQDYNRYWSPMAITRAQKIWGYLG